MLASLHRATLLAGFLIAGCASVATAASPGERRDPTVPPAAYAPRPASAPEPIDAFRPRHVVTVDGKRYLMWRGRRHAVGESVEGMRIERLEESEVWLRTGKGVRRLPLFPGIQKLPTTDRKQ